MHRLTWIVACCCLVSTTWVCAADVVIDQHQPVVLDVPDVNQSSLVLDIYLGERWRQLQLSLDDKLGRSLHADASAAVAFYHGQVVGASGSWVRLSWLADAWQGGIFLDGELLLLERRERVSQLLTHNDRSNSPHIMFSARDVRFLSTIDGGGLLGQQQRGIDNGSDLIDELRDSVVDPSMEVPLTLVLDTQFQDRYGSMSDAEALARLHLVDGLFRSQLGTGFQLLSLNPVSDNANMVDPHPSNLLHEFRDYMRTGPGMSIERVGVVNLLSGRDMTGGFVGSAWQGAVCQEHNHFSVNEDFGGLTLSALIMAHELGHNLGAPHDGTGACSDEPFDGIMHAQINGSDQFSNCSISEMALELAAASCLIDTSENLFRSDFEQF